MQDLICSQDDEVMHLVRCGAPYHSTLVLFAAESFTSSHHMKKTKAGLKGLYIEEMTLKLHYTTSK